MSFLSLSGLVDIDFNEALKSLDGFLNKVTDTVKKIEAKFGDMDTKGFSSQLIDITANVGKMALAFDVAQSSMLKGFKELRQAGGDAFDYIGSKSAELGKQATRASSDLENLNRTLMVHLRDKQKADAIMGNLAKYEVTSPFEMHDVGRAARKFVARGVSDPTKVDQYVRLAGEMAAVNDQDIGKAADALMKIKARSPEAYRSLKQNFTIGPDQLKAMGVTLDSGDRLRMRTSGDANAVLDALQKYYTTNTNMQAAQQQSLTIMGKWSSLQSQIFLTLASYADLVAPKIKAVIDWFKHMAEVLRDLSPTTKNMIANFVLFMGALSTVVAAITPVVLILGAFSAAIFHIAEGLIAIGIGFVALRSILTGMSGISGITAFFSALSANLASIPIKTGAAGLALQGLSSIAAGMGTKIGTMATGLATAFAPLVTLRNIAALPVGTAAAAMGPGGVGLAAAGAQAAAAAAVPVLGGMVPGAGGSFSAPMAAPPTPQAAVSMIGGTAGMISLAVLAFGAIAYVVADMVHSYHAKEGKKLEDESHIDTNQRQQTRLGVDEYINGKPIKNFWGKKGFGMSGGMSAEDQAKAKALLEKQVTQTEALEDTPEKKRRKEKEELRRVREGLDLVTGAPLSPEKAKIQREGEWRRDGFAKPKYSKEEQEDSVGYGALRMSEDERNSPENVAKDRLEKFLARQAKEGKGKTKEEMTELIKADERRMEGQAKMGYLSKSDILSQSASLRDRAKAAGESPDDVAKFDLKLRAAQVADLHQRMYDHIDKLRQKDVALDRLSYDKKINYAKQELKALTANTISQAEYDKNKKRNNEYIYLNERELAAREKKAKMYSPGLGNNINRDTEATTTQALRKRIAELKSYDPTQGKRVVTDEEQKTNNEKANAIIEREKEKHIANMNLLAQDFEASGKHLESQLVQLQMHYHSQKILVEKNSKELIALKKNYYAEQNKLRIIDAAEDRKVEDDQAQYKRDLLKRQTSRKLSGLEFDESRGARRPGEKLGLREELAKQGIEDAKKQYDAELKNINDKLIYEKDETERKKLKYRKKNIKKDRDEKIADIKKGTLESETHDTDVTKKEALANKYGYKKIESDSLALREKILSGQSSRAKTPEQVEKYGKQMEQNIKAQYNAQLDLLNIKEAENALLKDDTQRDIAQKELALQKKQLAEDFLEKMQQTTAEMEKQKKLLEDQKGGAGFTMGGIYNSYEEIIKHDQETAGKFKSQYDTGDDEAARSAAALKLGVNPMTKNSVGDTLKDMGNPGNPIHFNGVRPLLRGSDSYEREKSLQDNKRMGAADQNLTANFYLNIGGKESKMSQTQKLSGSQIANGDGMNPNHKPGGLA